MPQPQQQPHHVDIVHWAMGVQSPLAVTASGGKFYLQDNATLVLDRSGLEILPEMEGREEAPLSAYERQIRSSSRSAPQPWERSRQTRRGRTEYIQAEGSFGGSSAPWRIYQNVSGSADGPHT